MHYEHVVVDAVPGDVHDDRDPELRPRFAVFPSDLGRAWVLETYRVEDPGGRLRDSVLRVARSSRWSSPLVDDGTETRDIEELGVLDALPERPRSRHDGILQTKTARRLDREIDASLRIRGRRSVGVFRASGP